MVLATDLGIRVFFEVSIKHSVADLVANLICRDEMEAG